MGRPSHRAIRTFQSTLPVWGATNPDSLPSHAPCDFNPRSPCGERPTPSFIILFRYTYFNPRSPCGERRMRTLNTNQTQAFQSTLPVWGATNGRKPKKTKGEISIHAPRVGSDRSVMPDSSATLDFNPRSPCGERLSETDTIGMPIIFQSTLPVWGATIKELNDLLFVEFQSTLPVWGATSPSGCRCWRKKYFNPRSPCGERPGSSANTSVLPRISIHAPRVGSDVQGPLLPANHRDFNPRSPCGERPSASCE